MTEKNRMVIQIIRACQDCPYASRRHDGEYECAPVDFKRFPISEAMKTVQPWCPLDVAPENLTRSRQVWAAQPLDKPTQS